MTTDVTLSSPDRTIIIDAKYYRAALQTHYGARTVHSGNLYQLMAYLRGTALPSSAGPSLAGMLIYPVEEQTADLRFTIDGYRVRVYTLNLAQPWYGIEAELLDLLEGFEWHESTPMASPEGPKGVETRSSNPPPV